MLQAPAEDTVPTRGHMHTIVRIKPLGLGGCMLAQCMCICTFASAACTKPTFLDDLHLQCKLLGPPAIPLLEQSGGLPPEQGGSCPG